MGNQDLNPNAGSPSGQVAVVQRPQRVTIGTIVSGVIIIALVVLNSRYTILEQKMGNIVFAQVKHDRWTGKDCILWSVSTVQTNLPVCQN